MKSLVWKAMADGAVGFSTGLQYVPGHLRQPPEIIDLAGVAANAGGIYASHMRNEGTELEKSIAETIRVGEMTGGARRDLAPEGGQPEPLGRQRQGAGDDRRGAGEGDRRARRSVRLHRRELGPGHPLSLLGARGRAVEDRRAPEHAGHVGEDQAGDGGAARRARPARSVVRHRRDVPAGRVVQRPVDAADRATREGQRFRRRAVRGRARHAARGRRADGLSLHERRRRRSDHAASAGRDRVGQRRAVVRRRRAASARLRRQRPRPRDLRPRRAT